LVTGQMLVAGTDAARARPTARRPRRFPSGPPGYAASFARMGFTDTDIADVTGRLAGELLIWGDADTITTPISQHLQAGANHVMLACDEDSCRILSQLIRSGRSSAAGGRLVVR
jgi:hypothetical protein